MLARAFASGVIPLSVGLSIHAATFQPAHVPGRHALPAGSGDGYDLAIGLADRTTPSAPGSENGCASRCCGPVEGQHQLREARGERVLRRGLQPLRRLPSGMMAMPVRISAGVTVVTHRSEVE